MSNICCYPLGITIWYHILILTGWNFISSYPLYPLSYSRLVDNYLVHPPHCFTVCVSHHLSPHLCCLPHLIPHPLAVTLISHPKLLPLTHCASYCVTVYPLHQPSVTSSYCAPSDSGISTHCFVLLFIHQLNHPPHHYPNYTLSYCVTTIFIWFISLNIVLISK